MDTARFSPYLRSMRRILVEYLLFLPVIALILLPLHGTGQGAIVQKLTLSQVEELVSHGVPDSTMHTEILRRGLVFTPDPGTVESLRAKGAGPQTLAAIETFFPKANLTDSKQSVPTVGVLPTNFPPPTGYVNDLAGVLSPDVRTQLDRFCNQLDHSQADAQIAVVTIHTLDGADVAGFAKELFNKWGIGHKGTNRGVLVLLAVNDHKYRIAVGTGLESILTDAKAAEIGRGAAPLLHVNDYDRGVSLLVDQLAQFIADEAKVKLNDAPVQPQQR
jgi:hypothetical protein